MNASRFDEVRRLFSLALDQPDELRRHYVRDASEGDIELAQEVESLLDHSAPGRTLFESTLPGEESAPPGEALPLQKRSLEDPIEPKSFDGFEIEGLIGRGGAAVVYSARQAHPPRRVAIKILRDEPLSDNPWERFQREINVLARLQHPSIVPIYSAGLVSTLVGQRPYLVMKLVEGRPLLGYANHHRLSIAERLDLFLEVCAAVEHAHQRGVIHRDLKPSNLMVEDSPQGPRVCVLDFGIALMASETGAPTTEQGLVVGTLGYMSPEQALGRKSEVDARSDIYSLGIVLFELLTGVSPRSVCYPFAEWLKRLDTEPVPRLSRFDRRLRGGIEAIVGCCLETNAARRYQSVEQLSADIRRFLRKEPVWAQSPSAWRAALLFACRHRTAVAVALFTAFIIAAAGTSLVIAFAQLRKAYAELDARYTAALDRTQGEMRTAVDELGPIAGSQVAQRGILERARKELQELTIQRPHDDRVQSLVAEVLLRLSAIELREGRTDLALALRLQVLPTNEGLAARDPKNAAAARQLALNYVLVGDIHNERGEFQLALQWFRKAFDIHRELARRAPHDESSLDDLLWSDYRLAGSHSCDMSVSEASQLLEDAGRIAEQMLAEGVRSSSPYRAQWHLTSLRIRLARRVVQEDDHAPHVARLASLAQQLQTEFPNDHLALRCVIDTELMLGQVGPSSEDSVARFRAAVAAARRLVLLDPADDTLLRMLDHAICCCALGLAGIGRSEEAFELLTESTARIEARLLTNRRATENCADIIRCCHAWIAVEAWQGSAFSHVGLLTQLQASLPCLEEIADAAQQDASAIHEWLLDEQFAITFDPELALGMARAKLARNPCDPYWNGQLIRSLRKLGRYDEACAIANSVIERIPPEEVQFRSLIAEAAEVP